jgi:hypothetical protein
VNAVQSIVMSYLLRKSVASVVVEIGKTNSEFFDSSPESLRSKESRSSMAGSSILLLKGSTMEAIVAK